MTMATIKVSVPKTAADVKDGVYIFRLTNKLIPMTPNGSVYGPKKRLTPSQMAFDPASSKTRELRFVEGADSYFADEQVKLDPKTVENRIWAPEFINGTIRLEAPQEREKVLYMFTRDDYDEKERRIGSKVLFTWANKPEIDEDGFEELQLQQKAMQKAMELKDINAIIAHAKYLNIRLKDDFGQALSDKAIKTAYAKYAQRNPELFLKSFGSQVNELNELISRAITDGEIDLNKVKGQAHYKTGALIMPLDLTIDPKDQLIDFAASPKGKEFIKTLQGLYK